MKQDKMCYVCVSKYDNSYRKNGVFLREDWTSISDVGKMFNGEVLKYSEYEYFENLYLSVIEKICLELGVSKMRITDIEDPYNLCVYRSGDVLVGIDAIIDVARDCLREKFWCKLNIDNLFFHFGYDYYLYVGSLLDFQHISKLAHDIGLFVEKKKSPYV